MRQPQAPFLELCFYHANIEEKKAFSNLITALLEQGAYLTGEGLIHQGQAIRNKPFEGITDENLVSISLSDLNHLNHLLADENIRIVQVCLQNATNISAEVVEKVRYLRVSTEAATTDHHPLALIAEGSWFDWTNYSGNVRNRYKQQAKIKGLKIYQRFLELIKSLKPSYAAITFEWDLECPTDLRKDPRSLAFKNFYVSNNYLGSSKIDLIQKLFSEAYVETIEDGIYVSCSQELNPDRIGLPSEYGYEKAKKVAKLIAFS